MNKKNYFLSLILLLLVFFVGCSSKVSNKTNNSLDNPGVFSISGFPNNTYLSSRYTCQGEDIHPALSFNNTPAGTHSFVITVTDPDANDFVHWVVWNVMRNFSEGQPVGIEGLNSFGSIGWRGPCPPSGTHHYVFTAYALDSELGLAEGSSIQEVKEAIKGRVLAQAEIVGLYQKK